MTARADADNQQITDRGVADLLLIVLLFLIIAAIRITAPSDLATGDQPLQVAYIRDITDRGSWLVQHLDDGTVQSKPPLYNWLAAAGIELARTKNELLLKLPSLFAGLAALLLTWDLGRRIAGRNVATAAALLLTCSTMFSKQIYFARTDMLLGALIVLQVWAGYLGRRALFWFAAAMSLLAKGPIGIIIPALVLGLFWWALGEGRFRWREMRPAIGLPLALAPLLVWFALAFWAEGGPVFDQLVEAETIDRFAAGSKSKEHRHVLYYLPHFLARMAPASFLSVAALWRLRKERRSAMFLIVIWALSTLLFFSLIPSKRVDRLFPMLPAVAILAGWAMEQRTKDVRVLLRIIAALLVISGVILLSGGAGIVSLPSMTGGSMLAAAVLVAAAAMMAFSTFRENRGSTLGFLVVSMVAVIFIYQHELSVPAQQAIGGDAVVPSARLSH